MICIKFYWLLNSGKIQQLKTYCCSLPSYFPKWEERHKPDILLRSQVGVNIKLQKLGKTSLACVVLFISPCGSARELTMDQQVTKARTENMTESSAAFHWCRGSFKGMFLQLVLIIIVLKFAELQEIFFSLRNIIQLLAHWSFVIVYIHSRVIFKPFSQYSR